MCPADTLPSWCCRKWSLSSSTDNQNSSMLLQSIWYISLKLIRKNILYRNVRYQIQNMHELQSDLACPVLPFLWNFNCFLPTKPYPLHLALNHSILPLWLSVHLILSQSDHNLSLFPSEIENLQYHWECLGNTKLHVASANGDLCKLLL